MRRSSLALLVAGSLAVSAAFAATSSHIAFAGAAAVPSAGVYVPITANTLLDTTTGVGAPLAPVAPHGTVVVGVNGHGGIPADATAVAMDVIVVSPPLGGFATVYPSGTARPGTSNIDFTAHQRIANLVITKTGNASINLYNGSNGSTNFVVNAIGYYAGGSPTVAGGFVPVTPTNVLDTGTGIGTSAGPVPAHGTVSLQLTGDGVIPSTGVSAVVLDIAYIAPTRSGFGTVYPADISRPGTSNIDFVAPQTISNLVITKLSATGAVDIYNGSSGTVRIEANVFGYFAGASPTAAGALVPVTPANILDTGAAIGVPTTAPVAAHATVTFQVAGRGGVPATGVQSAILNMAVVAPGAGGYATLYPSDAVRPPAANLNFTPNRTIANLAITQVSSTGAISIYNGSASTVRFEANVLGYTIATPPAAVSGVAAMPSFTSVKLTWTNPNSASLAGVLIRRNVGANPPSAPNAGTLVADVDSPTTTYTDAALVSPGTAYSYSLFSHDATNDFGPIASVTVTTSAEITWGTPTTINTATFGAYDSVSCPTTTFCGASTDKSFWTTFNGATWTSPTAIGMATTATDCVSATFCAAIGGSTAASFRTYDGTSWSAATVVDAAHAPLTMSCGSTTFCMVAEAGGWLLPIVNGVGGTPSKADTVAISSLSCLSRTFCVALDGNGRALRYNGTQWTVPAAIPAFGGTCPGQCSGMDVGCTSTTFCVLVAPSASAATFNGATWALVASGGSMDAVSCASSTFCVAVGGGASKTFDGSTFDAPRIPVSGVAMTDVSCVTKTFCVAVGGGDAVVGS